MYRPVGRRAWLRGLLVAGCAVGVAGGAWPKPVKLPAPGPRDTCPVCGMFVAPYPYWIATVVWRDGKAVHFDGPKDFFKYLLELPKYEPGRQRSDIVSMGVTDYYGTQRIDAAGAWYVIGSDVLGPMGHELVPQDTEADAKEFMADHKGRRVLRLADVTMPLLLGLDAGKFP
ncbi:nitrous oxide reductase accessory protein NosL [Hydrogenophaga sp.]|uniref:nitrous oxide reductase accessory protein NosL n=1 Tax=Hydrogenophaga sp. TaxID=1904254 RepID=UPI0035AEBDC2